MTSLALFSTRALCTFLIAAVAVVDGLRFDINEDPWNLNKAQLAENPLDYRGEELEEYYPSPKDWRFPFYTIFLDRFINGDPTNDNANGTVYEADIMSNQLRFGGDLDGLVDSLDYIQGMGVKVISLQLGPGHRWR